MDTETERKFGDMERLFKERQDISQDDRARIEQDIKAMVATTTANQSSIEKMSYDISHMAQAIEASNRTISEWTSEMQRDRLEVAKRVTKFHDIIEKVDGHENGLRPGLVQRVDAIELSRAKDRAFFLGIMSVASLIIPVVTVAMQHFFLQWMHG